MSETPIHPVILAGGTGTRLWPLSRASFPKQFAPLTGAESLFQACARRLSGPGFAAPMVVTGADFRFLAAEQLTGVGIDPGAVLIEPEARNTAPAVLAAALHLAASDPEAVMLVAPADHSVPDPAAFREAARAGLAAAGAGELVTFGIAPDRAETGYGYLELAGEAAAGAPAKLRRLVEKPGTAEAEAMLAAGGYLWNAGIFLFSARAIIAAFEAHSPDLVDPVRRAVAGAEPDLGFLRLAAKPWGEAAPASLDTAVMEKAENLSVVPFAGGWSDLGGWPAVWREAGPDGDGMATAGPATAIDCRASLLRAESGKQRLVGIGLDGMVAVAMPDAVLVAPMERAGEIGAAVGRLAAEGAPEATEFPLAYRPWGSYESLVRGERFQVKRIVVDPGGMLSLQSHYHRAEHWIVVAGTALVEIDGEERLVSENQSVYVPIGSRHRLSNPGRVAVVLIEVQTGAYLDEDDIRRFEDIYARA